jgi:hypothetical protein
VDDTTNSIVRESIPASEYKHRLMPAMSCEGVSAGKILGLAVNYKEETGDMGAANGYQWEASTLTKEWLATDLGCFVLQKESIWTRKSDGFILVDTKLTPISVSFQPTDEFFQIPASYTERTKKEARALLP